MSEQSKNNKKQPQKNVDEIIEEALENAESRRELSQDELDEVDGGRPPIIVGRRKE